MTSGAEAAVLLQGLSMFLGETVRPAVADKGTAFRVRIAQHLAMSLALELSVGEAHDRAALTRLGALLNQPATAETASWARDERTRLDAELAVQLRSGADLQDPRIRAHILQSLRDELSITNPRFDLRKDLP